MYSNPISISLIGGDNSCVHLWGQPPITYTVIRGTQPNPDTDGQIMYFRCQTCRAILIDRWRNIIVPDDDWPTNWITMYV